MEILGDPSPEEIKDATSHQKLGTSRKVFCLEASGGSVALLTPQGGSMRLMTDSPTPGQ